MEDIDNLKKLVTEELERRKDKGSELMKISDKEFVELFNGTGHWRLNKNLTRKIGIDASLLTSDLLSKWNYFREHGNLNDGYFFNIKKGIQESLCLSQMKLDRAFDKLKDLRILDVKERVGIPAKNYYKVNLEIINILIQPEPETELTSELGGYSLENKGVIHINNNKFNENKRIISSPIGEDGGVPKEPTPHPTTRLARLTGMEMLRAGISSPGMVPSTRAIPDPVVAPKEVQSLIDFWNSLGGVRHQNVRSNVYRDAVKKLKLLLRGRMFSINHHPKYLARAFSVSEIETVFARFKESLKDPKERKYLRGLSLPNFLFHSWNGRSMFLELFESPSNSTPRNYVTQLEADPKPEVTAIFKKFYVKEVLGGIPTSFTAVQENKFRLATKKAMEFLKANQKRMSGLTSVQDYANLVCDALRDWVRGNVKDLNVGNFPSDHTWTKVVPAYMAHVSVTESYSAEED